MNMPLYYICEQCEGKFPSKDYSHETGLCKDCFNAKKDVVDKLQCSDGLIVLLKKWDAEADRLMKSAKRCSNPIEKAAYRGTALKTRFMMKELMDIIEAGN